MKLFTIGFTGKSAEEFFHLLNESEATRLIDIRINRTSQLAGFTKEQDLRFFLPRLVGMDYLVREDLAPTKELLALYRNKGISWVEFSQGYQDLMHSRKVFESLTPALFNNSVLLCSEHESEMCHRTLLANKLAELFPSVRVVNLV